ncbi:diaminobutyrate acetyltransferase [Thioclava sp. SK-1]|uniref:diaminobutyrate acetyltransferase n=1 Tax=Thioclava sp. SK-1 TaxID=1889770 RepID=UPI0008255BEC|nr:diaminobutyrate acetyltransferase [Thioclava sp. SK-1]OCX65960.1 diaminobutyrate acetyltransferase [Thioclava sp. SK-1]
MKGLSTVSPVELAITPDITFRKPTSQDGAEIWSLIKQCKPLDENSMYCNLLQCDHFADTCVLVERDGQPIGWVSGYITPSCPETFFVWQVAVSPAARGLGLGKRMLKHLLNRPEAEACTKMKTTITKSNEASWGLFRSFARSTGGDLTSEAHFHKDDHFDGHASTEHMVTICYGSGADVEPNREEDRAAA